MYMVYKNGCIVSRQCTRTDAVLFAEKIGYNKKIPAKLNCVYIVKERETDSVGKMRVKNSRNTWNKMEFAGIITGQK